MLEIAIFIGLLLTIAFGIAKFLEWFQERQFQKFLENFSFECTLTDETTASAYYTTFPFDETETLTDETKDFIPSPCFNTVEEYEDYIKNN